MRWRYLTVGLTVMTLLLSMAAVAGGLRDPIVDRDEGVIVLERDQVGGAGKAVEAIIDPPAGTRSPTWPRICWWWRPTD